MKPIAVFLTCRDRLAVMKKCLDCLFDNTIRPIHLFVFDNLTTYRVGEQWGYFCSLYESGKLQKYVCNTSISTYNAFSKAMAFNEFGLFIEAHPDKNVYEFLLCLDNDMMIVDPGWDDFIVATRESLQKREIDVEIIAQYPGGCSGTDIDIEIHDAKYKARIGFNSGSGFWCLKPDFFSKVGLLEPELLVGINKRHDIEFWAKLARYTKGKPYVAAVDRCMALHFGYYNGKDLSICKPTRNDPSKRIVFEDIDQMVDEMTYEEFLEMIKKDQDVLKMW